MQYLNSLAACWLPIMMLAATLNPVLAQSIGAQMDRSNSNVDASGISRTDLRPAETSRSRQAIAGRGGAKVKHAVRDAARPRVRRGRAGSARSRTAGSATIVSHDQLNERNPQTLAEAVAYTPEASIDAGSYDPRGDGIDIRGYDTTYNAIYRDGLLQGAANLAIPRVEPYGVEAVDVLRGPAAGIYGFNSPAGILNVVTKQPKFEPFGEVQLQVGNYDRYQGNFDFGGPIEGSDGTMAYRLTGVLRQANTFLPGGPDDRRYGAPAFTWKPDADTTFTVLAEYMNLRLPSNPSFFYGRGYVVSKFYEGDPRFGTLQQDQYRIGYAFEHKFSPDLIIRQNARYSRVGIDFPAVFGYGNFIEFGILDNLSYTGRGKELARQNFGSATIDNRAEIHFNTGPIGHRLITGINYIRYDDNFRETYSIQGPDFSFVAPNYGLQPISRPALLPRARQTIDRVGIYALDQAKWDRFILTFGARFDQVFTRTTTNSPSGFDQTTTNLILNNMVEAGELTRTVTRQRNSALTYRVGLDYLLTETLTPYASYATNFTVQPGVTSDIDLPIPGRPVNPFTGDQIDAGLKFTIPEISTTGTLSFFNIRQKFGEEIDLTTFFYQFAPGSTTSRGVELTATANLAPGTNLTLGYRHLDFRYTRQDAVVDGITGTPRSSGSGYDLTLVNQVARLDGGYVAGIPSDTFTAFGTYLFPPSSPLSGLTIGGGIRFSGPTFANDQNSVLLGAERIAIRNPTVTLFDTVVAYDLAALDLRYKGFRAQINGFNILDRNYTVCQNLFCQRGAPATVIGSLVYRW